MAEKTKAPSWATTRKQRRFFHAINGMDWRHNWVTVTLAVFYEAIMSALRKAGRRREELECIYTRILDAAGGEA